MKKRILVVDDDKINLKITQMNLSDYGYEVFTADKGMEAIRLLRSQEVDLIVLDIEMPIVNGIRTLELIRKRPEMAEIPVIFLTALLVFDISDFIIDAETEVSIVWL